MRGAVGARSPSSTKASRPSTMARRVRRARAARPSMAGSRTGTAWHAICAPRPDQQGDHMDVNAALDAARQKLRVGKVLVDAGILRLERPDRLLAVGSALRRWGPTIAGGYIASTGRRPDAPAVIDEAGSLTFAEVHRRTNAIAAGLAARGIGAGDGVGILCRNHRGFVEASVAVSKLGANVLYLNTGFAGPQLAEVLEREGAKAVVFDAEFAEL